MLNGCVPVMQEHKCVLDSCRTLEMEGFEVTYLPVQKNGIVNMKVRYQYFSRCPLFVSFTQSQNMTGFRGRF